MKGIKRKISLLLVCILLFSSTSTSVYAVEIPYMGFTYDDVIYDVQWKSGASYKVYSELNEELGTLTYVIGMLKLKNDDKYTLLIRLVMTPNDDKVAVRINSSYHGQTIYGYGLSEYVSINTIVPGPLGEYQPTNDPGVDNVELSIGTSFASDGISGEISASYGISHQDLDITSKCNTPNKQYYVIYNYKPSLLHANEYLTEESIHLGMAQFENTNTQQTLVFNFDARFGASIDEAASPTSILWNVVYSKTAQKTYTFSF